MIEPYYASDDVTLYHGDCLDLMGQLDGLPADMVLADLPYGTTRNQWDRELPNKLLWAAYDEVVGDRTPIVLFSSGSFGARLIVSNIERYRYSLVWQKLSVSGFLNAKRQPLRSHEDLHVFYGRQPTYNPQMEDVGRRSHSRGRRRDRTVHHYGLFENTEVPEDQPGQYPRSVLRSPNEVEPIDGSVLTFQRPKLDRGKGHPTQKPVDLCRYLIRTYTNPGDLVLDNVCGSGTTLVAARAEGRRAIGIDIEEKWCELAASRLE